MGKIEKILVKACDNCPLCNYAREHTETLVGKFMSWHGAWCPVWKGWEREYGKKDEKTGDNQDKQ